MSAPLRELPASVDELLDALDTLYPNRCIERGEAPEDAHRRAGARELVDHLLSLRKRSIDREMRGKVTWSTRDVSS